MKPGELYNRKVKKRKIVTDNKMRSFGDFDENTGKIRINKRKAKKAKKGNYPELADTIYHESYHKKHPKATEKTTYKKTKQAMKRLGKKTKAKLYAKVR